MLAEKLLVNRDKVARINDLYTIEYCVFSIPGTSSFSARERRYLFFLISLVKSGYTEIRAPMAAIADSIYRAQGQTASVTTLRTAFRELESKGFITRKRCRLGKDVTGALIQIHVERFVFWTRIRTLNITPYPTRCDNSRPQQVSPGDDRRITSGVVNSQDSSIKRKDGSNARTHSKKSAKIHRYHPIVFTLLCVLPRSPQKKAAIQLAEREIASGSSPQSGIDWPHFSQLWRALDPSPGGGRERTARREIAPLLIEAVQRGGAQERETYLPPLHPCLPFPAPDLGTESPEDIKRIIAASVMAVSPPQHEPQDDPQGADNVLTAAELAILRAAKEAGKNRW